MISEHNIQSLVGATVIGADGDKIGTLGQIYVDPETGRPNWATVKTGFFGMSESFVPLEQADQNDGEVRVPYTKDVVKDAPNIDPDREISDDEEDRLYDYYRGPGSVDGDRGRDGVYDDDRAGGYDDDRAGGYDDVRATGGTYDTDRGRSGRRRHDAFRGAPQCRHRAGADRPGAAAQVRRPGARRIASTAPRIRPFRHPKEGCYGQPALRSRVGAPATPSRRISTY